MLQNFWDTLYFRLLLRGDEERNASKDRHAGIQYSPFAASWSGLGVGSVSSAVAGGGTGVRLLQSGRSRRSVGGRDLLLAVRQGPRPEVPKLSGMGAERSQAVGVAGSPGHCRSGRDRTVRHCWSDRGPSPRHCRSGGDPSPRHCRSGRGGAGTCSCVGRGLRQSSSRLPEPPATFRAQ